MENCTQDPEPGGLALSRSGAKLITGWNLLAQVVDRLAFLLYLFTIELKTNHCAERAHLTRNKPCDLAGNEAWTINY